MADKVKLPCITDTVLIEGIYQIERRSYIERRRRKCGFVHYERRKSRDSRLSNYKSIDENV